MRFHGVFALLESVMRSSSLYSASVEEKIKMLERAFRGKLRKDEMEVDTATSTSAQSSSSSSHSALSSSPSSPAHAEEKEAKEKTDRRDQEEQKQQGQRDETGRVARGATKQHGVTTHN